MASEPKGSELDRLLDEATERPVRPVRNGDNGDRFRLDHEADDIWAGCDPEQARERTTGFSGSWRNIDPATLKRCIRGRRRIQTD